MDTKNVNSALAEIDVRIAEERHEAVAYASGASVGFVVLITLIAILTVVGTAHQPNLMTIILLVAIISDGIGFVWCAKYMLLSLLLHRELLVEKQALLK